MTTVAPALRARAHVSSTSTTNTRTRLGMKGRRRSGVSALPAVVRIATQGLRQLDPAAMDPSRSLGATIAGGATESGAIGHGEILVAPSERSPQPCRPRPHTESAPPTGEDRRGAVVPLWL
ncbi:hypothetical protein ACIP8U_26190 [Streptomyces pseudovenezuelae]|uniref:hypothetical protein n=1 Tax=Streptomyces pseudovenezuelae TaxID=67350 RepID=UPI003810710C